MSESAVKHSSQGAFFLWHGLTISKAFKLLAMGPPIDFSRWYKLALMPGTATFSSLFAGIESLRFGSKIRATDVKQPPVFVLGFWRSGTTMLHNLVSSDPQLCYPNYYQCLYPHHFLSTESWLAPPTARFLPDTRPMDNLPVGWNMPQEDEIALCVLSLASCYLQVIFHDNVEKYQRFHNMADCTDAERKAWMDSLEYLIRKLTLKYQKRVVLKSPSHTFKIPYLLKLYPDAKFIYIYRNPYAVFKSATHLRRTMYAENGMCEPDYGDIDERVFELYEQCFHDYERDKALIPAGNLSEVRFEDFEQDPLMHLQRIYGEIGLGGFDALRQKIEPQLAELKRYKKNRFKPDAERMQKVYARLRQAFDRYGYPSPMDEAETAAA
ncbi:Sulfotransferase domain protein [Caulifigura coniformis]|uniref:Sulfotransferase domain protein n=1 Tax=Caulifigura coniformis TaxID=2527983 RepID=A0A517SFA5_9PLAN|nr:sulfotransferase [Caulifigura coniformis]QDT54812.1 Sulfotransferase domain protein [Caulifigura coniformis]